MMFGEYDEEEDDLSVLSTLSGAHDSLALQQYLRMKKEGRTSSNSQLTSSKFSPFAPTTLSSTNSRGASMSPMSPMKGSTRLGVSIEPSSSTIHSPPQTAVRALLKTALSEKGELEKKLQSEEKVVSAMKTNMAVLSTANTQSSSVLKATKKSALARTILEVFRRWVVILKGRAFRCFIYRVQQCKLVKANRIQLKLALLCLSRNLQFVLKRVLATWSSAVQSIHRAKLTNHGEKMADQLTLLLRKAERRLFKRWHRITTLRRNRRKALNRLFHWQILKDLRGSFQRWIISLHKNVVASLRLARKAIGGRSIQIRQLNWQRDDEHSRHTLVTAWLRWQNLSNSKGQSINYCRSRLVSCIKFLSRKLSIENVAFQRWRRGVIVKSLRVSKLQQSLSRLVGQKLSSLICRRFHLWRKACLMFHHHRLISHRECFFVMKSKLAHWRSSVSTKRDVQSIIIRIHIITALAILVHGKERIILKRRFSHWVDSLRSGKVWAGLQTDIIGLQNALRRSENSNKLLAQDLQDANVFANNSTIRYQAEINLIRQNVMRRSLIRVALSYEKFWKLNLLPRFRTWVDVIHLKRNNRIALLESLRSRMISAGTSSINRAWHHWCRLLLVETKKLTVLRMLCSRVTKLLNLRYFSHWKNASLRTSALMTHNRYRAKVLKCITCAHRRAGMSAAWRQWKVFTKALPVELLRRGRRLSSIAIRVETKVQRGAFYQWCGFVQKHRSVNLGFLRNFFSLWKSFSNSLRHRKQQVVTLWKRAGTYPLRRSFRMWYRAITKRALNARSMSLLLGSVTYWYTRRLNRCWSKWRSVLHAANVKGISDLRVEANRLFTEREQFSSICQDLESREINASEVRRQLERKASNAELLCRKLFGQVQSMIKARQSNRRIANCFSSWRNVLNERKLFIKEFIRVIARILETKCHNQCSKAFRKWFSFSLWSESIENLVSDIRQRKMKAFLHKILSLWSKWCTRKRYRRLEIFKITDELSQQTALRQDLVLKQQSTGFQRLMRILSRLLILHQAKQIRRCLFHWMRVTWVRLRRARNVFAPWFEKWRFGRSILRIERQRRLQLVHRISGSKGKQVLALGFRRWAKFIGLHAVRIRRHSCFVRAMLYSSQQQYFDSIRRRFHRWVMYSRRMGQVETLWIGITRRMAKYIVRNAWRVWLSEIEIMRRKESLMSKTIHRLIQHRYTFLRHGIRRWASVVQVTNKSLRDKFAKVSARQNNETLKSSFFAWRQSIRHERIMIRLHGAVFSKTISDAQDLIANLFSVSHPRELPADTLNVLDSNSDLGSSIHAAKVLAANSICLLQSTLKSLSSLLLRRFVHPSIFILDALNPGQFLGVSSLDPEDGRFLFSAKDTDIVDNMVPDRLGEVESNSNLVYVAQIGVGVIGRCAATGRSSQYFTGNSKLAAIAIPLFHKGSIVGVVHLSSTSPMTVAMERFVAHSTVASGATELDRYQLLKTLALQIDLPLQDYLQIISIVSALPDLLGLHLEHLAFIQSLKISLSEKLMPVRESINELRITESKHLHQVAEMIQSSRELNARVEHLTKSRERVVESCRQRDAENSKLNDALTATQKDAEKLRSALHSASRKLRAFEKEKQEMERLHSLMISAERSTAPGLMEMTSDREIWLPQDSNYLEGDMSLFVGATPKSSTTSQSFGAGSRLSRYPDPALKCFDSRRSTHDHE